MKNFIEVTSVDTLTVLNINYIVRFAPVDDAELKKTIDMIQDNNELNLFTAMFGSALSDKVKDISEKTKGSNTVIYMMRSDSSSGYAEIFVKETYDEIKAKIENAQS